MGCGGGGGGGDNKVKETAYEVELSKITQEEWGRFKNTYQPLFTKLTEDVQGIGQAEKNVVGGSVGAGVTKIYGDVADNTKKSIAARGLDPSAGAVALGDVGREKASTMTQGIVKGQSQVDDAKVAGLQNIVNMYRGDAGEAMRGISDIAGDQVADAAQKAYYKQQSRNDNLEAAATAAGMGLSYGANNNWFKAKPGG